MKGKVNMSWTWILSQRLTISRQIKISVRIFSNDPRTRSDNEHNDRHMLMTALIFNLHARVVLEEDL